MDLSRSSAVPAVPALPDHPTSAASARTVVPPGRITGELRNKARTTGEFRNKARTTGEFRNKARTTGEFRNPRTTGEIAKARTTGEFAKARTTGEFARSPLVPPVPPARITGEFRPALRSGEFSRTLGEQLPWIQGVRSAESIHIARITGSHPGPRAVPPPRTRSEIANRALNIVLASAALVILSPFLLLIAALVKLTSPGPILYTQSRVGLDRRSRRALALYDRRARDVGGSVFTIYKFRSMSVDAEQNCGAVWATPNDPRVTPIGRFLRTTRLDELPQLINVLKGEMNIVGPRPERPSIALQLRQDISDYPLRHRAKPGITGWAQIHAAYDSSVDDVRVKVRYDLEYLRRQSMVEDVRIMLKTLPVMLFKHGGW